MAITTKAKALRAAGAPVIGYGAGEPDFATPDHIVAAAVVAARDPKNHKYSPAVGLPELKAAVAKRTLQNSGFSAEPNQVVITKGGKQAVYLTCQALLDPGDEVLLPAPYWVTYPETIKLADGVPVYVDADDTAGFKVTVAQLEAARTPKTKMLIFVSPSNPTGAVYTRDEIKAIGEWAVEHEIWVMTDEIYEHLVYGDAEFSSLPVEVPELAERCVIVNGVAKTYAMTGWRVGWLIGPEAVAKGVGKLVGHMTSNVANVSQRAALAAVEGSLDSVYEMRGAFDRRRLTMHSMLNATNGVTCLEPDGAFYAFPNMTGMLNRDLNGKTASTTLELATIVLDEIQVAFVPGEAFGLPGYARFSFALADDDLAEGLKRLQDFAS
ncbi:MAG: pyridoxal phosphate-dependent aminotransferase [Acidimicrobiia bacterium]|nr:pyridoxal phosphate-dependent aminotransferase [Acidimicrobiia bacterium]MDX2468303.1 pyridoxal phosphate-dependent aminotransferase [Acidimicrobiia bacterium]